MTKVHYTPVVHVLSLIILMVFITGSVFEVSAQRRGRTRTGTNTVPRSAERLTIPAGTIIKVRMDTELNSRTARVGSRFSTTVTEPVHAPGNSVAIPAGSKVRGKVQSVNRAGEVTPSFHQVELPEGIYPINGSMTSLQADDVNADNESTVSGRRKRKNVLYIGGGYASNPLIGVKLNRSVSLPAQ